MFYNESLFEGLTSYNICLTKCDILWFLFMSFSKLIICLFQELGSCYSYLQQTSLKGVYTSQYTVGRAGHWSIAKSCGWNYLNHSFHPIHFQNHHLRNW